MTQGTLETDSLWYKYKTEVWLQKSEQAAVVHNIMRLVRAVRNYRELAYVSVPITSGKFLYDLQKRHPEMTRNAQVDAAITHNYLAGWNFVEELQKRRDCPILYPADLVPIHQQWEQNHFQALWLSIIAEKCTEMHMSDGWEFSNGGSEEFTHVMQLKLGVPRHPDLLFFNTKENEAAERQRMAAIKVYDHRGAPLGIEDGISAIERSLQWVVAEGFAAPKLENCLRLLRSTNDMARQGFYQ